MKPVAMVMRRAALCGVAVCAAVIAPVFAQNSVEPPAEQKAMLTAKGDGVQIYVCKDAAGGAQWTLVAPDAKLLDASGKVIGTHGAGPHWKSVDGSLVKGQVVAKNNAPGAGDVAWLLLKASGHEGDGVMSKVEYIRRTETHGGAAPAAGCDAQHLNVEVRVPYTATYTFYSAKN
ncbi:MAG TPA: DUF3455 domain-containing protein [Candidatus Dormibacteraeota bacterium]|nr:DUF3455 domain-containing protein [Candidatus Dormibacteraeota bacterium]